jgi:hypothetical protein
MPHIDSETIRFRTCRGLHGDLLSITCGKRNGQPAIFLPRNLDGAEDATDTPAFDEQTRLFVNLNPVERETWRKILAARSIASIAQEEGVSRSAIYARIHGNRYGQGGMIGKNFWVLRWWQLRQQRTAGVQ